ncbi:MAG: hypothetical protein KDD37_03835, partial [Bdellovibrionales bacterium]|nr:hypothetical protein [Bdellovibrionales bacterium]
MILVFILLSQIFAAKSEVKSLQITGELGKIEGTNIVVNLKEITSFHHNIPIIHPKYATTKAERDWISLSNMESKWLTGKRYVYIKGVRVEITLAQEIEILKYHAKLKRGESGPALTDDERQYLNLKLAEIQDAVDKKVLTDMYKDKFRAEMISTTRDASEAVEKAASKSGGNIFIVILDGLPYFLGNLPSGNIAEYGLTEKTLRLKSDLGLACNLPTTPPANSNLKLKLDSYYSTLTHLSYRGSDTMFIADTVESTAFCDVLPPQETIFKGGFEA